MDHKWISQSNGSIPSEAVAAGVDSDGDAIYIGRASFNNDLLPAKVIPNKGKAYVSHGGQEHEVSKYDVLCGLYYSWASDTDGNVPPTAVKSGLTCDGETLYVGRGFHQGSLTVGKIHPSHGCLYIPYGESEVKLTSYEVLVQPEQWIEATPDCIPRGAIVAGNDSDGDTIYVGRLKHGGDLLPAKVIPAKGGAYVCYGGEEVKSDNFQMLVGAGFVWADCEEGQVLPGAVPSGNTSDGETLYVGRGHYNGSLSVGKVHPSHECLYLPYGGEEVKLDQYEVLVRV
ncbi:uncharacterized protein LOC129948065 isoform X2 [Eupeodes corollae]|uniref:uncharacterized protein LOC129948065 isoform X2 n=1 Tax=Eupeodes corollae TaxID=290404 RepID=UPI002490DF7C|nr:uncharacterized protein LOC129948065 isoform X2 [Eupeodes corollae]